jgi:hypothetical protein
MRGSKAVMWALVPTMGMMLISGCITMAAVAAVTYVASKSSTNESGGGGGTKGAAGLNSYMARVEVKLPAQKVYQTVVALAEEHAVQFLARDDNVRMLEVSDGAQTASVMVLSLGPDMCELAVTASAPAGATVEEHRELALRIVSRVCERLDVKYKIVKG